MGFVLGPALGGLASLGGPHVPFYVAGGLALVNGIIALRRLPETRRPGSAAGGLPRDRKAARVWSMALATFVAVCAFSGFEATFALLTKERFGLKEGGVAAVFVGIGILLVVVQGDVVRRVTARIGAARTLEAGLVLNVAGLAVLAAAESWGLLIPALVLLSFGQGLVSPALTLTVTDRVPDHQRGEALGFQQGTSAVARVAGPALAGVLFQHVGIPSPYLVGAALCGVALLVVTLSRPAAGVPAATGVPVAGGSGLPN